MAFSRSPAPTSTGSFLALIILLSGGLLANASPAQAQPAEPPVALPPPPPLPPLPPEAPPAAPSQQPAPAPPPGSKMESLPERGPAGTQPSPTPPRIGWEDGVTVIDSEHAHLEFSNHVWALFVAEFPNATTALDPADGSTTPPPAGQSRAEFRVRKAETTIEGWFWRKEIGYEFETTYREPGGILNHALVDWDALGNGALRLTFGQFKAPFGRQELTSSRLQQFVDRSFISDLFSPAEQQGVQLHGRVLGNKLEYWAGMFNGNGRNGSGRNAEVNDNTHFQYDGRVQLEPWGEVGYSESDFESTDHPLVAFALEAQHDNRRDAAFDGGMKRLTFGADVTLKWKGFSFFSQGFLRDEVPQMGMGPGSFATLAVAAQAGYFLWKRDLELAVRQATLDPRRHGSHDLQHESGVDLNWYIYGRTFKVQTDFRRLQDQSLDSVSWQWRLQTYFSF